MTSLAGLPLHVRGRETHHEPRCLLHRGSRKEDVETIVLNVCYQKDQDRKIKSQNQGGGTILLREALCT
jgi:hypothetical protein